MSTGLNVLLIQDSSSDNCESFCPGGTKVNGKYWGSGCMNR